MKTILSCLRSAQRALQKKKKKKVQDWEPFEAVTVTDDITLPITGRILVYKRADKIQTLMMSCN